MALPLRRPFVIVIASAAVACSNATPSAESVGTVALPSNPPRLVTAEPTTPREPAARSDRDGDDIADEADACPDAPGPMNDRPERNGCPRVVVQTSNPPAPIQTVMFDGRDTEPNASSGLVIDAVAEILRSRPDITLLRIEGHEDPSSAGKALDISRARADAVVNALAKRGIDRTRLRAVGLGGHCPIAAPGTKDARSKNRRAQMKIEATDKGPTEIEVGCGPSRDAGIR